MFSFIEKVFQPFIFGDVINLRELKNVFFYREIVFQNLVISQFQPFLWSLGLFIEIFAKN